MRCLRLQERRGQFLQHLHVVIGFQHQHIRGADAFEHQFGHVAKVGDEPDVAGGGVNQKSDRVLRVVRDGERVHEQVGDFKARAGFKQVAVEFGLQLKFKRLLGGAVAINRDVQFLRDAGQAVNVVAVFVGDENGGEIFRRAPDAGEALADLARAESRRPRARGLRRFRYRRNCRRNRCREW